MTERTPEEKAARKEFFRKNGKEIHRKQQEFNTLIKTPVNFDNNGFIDHPVYIGHVAKQTPKNFVIQGWIPSDACWTVDDSETPLHYIRVDWVLYPESWLKPGYGYMKISRENGEWYGHYSEARFTPGFRVMKSKQRSYPAFIPIFLFTRSDLIRQDL